MKVKIIWGKVVVVVCDLLRKYAREWSEAATFLMWVAGIFIIVYGSIGELNLTMIRTISITFVAVAAWLSISKIAVTKNGLKRAEIMRELPMLIFMVHFVIYYSNILAGNELLGHYCSPLIHLHLAFTLIWQKRTEVKARTKLRG